MFIGISETKLYFSLHKKVSQFFIDMDKPVVFISCQYMQSWVSFIKLTLATVAWTYLSMPLQQLILLLLRLQLWWFRTKTFSNWYWSLLLHSQTLLCQIIVGYFFLVNCSWCFLELVATFLLTFWFFPDCSVSLCL